MTLIQVSAQYAQLGRAANRAGRALYRFAASFVDDRKALAIQERRWRREDVQANRRKQLLHKGKKP